MANIKLVQIDGKLPNLALMKLSHWHKSLGDNVLLSHSVQPTFFEQGSYQHIYGSAIFTKSIGMVRQLASAYPDAIIGGTGSGQPLDKDVEAIIGVDQYEHYDYSIYPEYQWSIGFTQRGCRLNCGFCVVPAKEGKPRSTNTVQDIWRPNTERCVVLLDNDFFGQPENQWQARIEELVAGNFKVSFNQGVNIRLINEQTAEALASTMYYDDQFKTRRLYTAWDNLGQERIFFRGVEHLQAAGIPATHLMVYMLIGYKPGETMDEVMYRYERLVSTGCKPYPMVYNDSNRELKAFQRWVIRRYAEFVPWDDYRNKAFAKDHEQLELTADGG